MKIKAIRVKSWSLEPEIIEIGLSAFLDEKNVEWVRPNPGVTGFESAQLKKLIDEYLDKPVFSRWVACSGTLNKYDRLEIPIFGIIQWLEKINRISVEKEYGYITKIHWNDSLSQTVKKEK